MSVAIILVLVIILLIYARWNLVVNLRRTISKQHDTRRNETDQNTCSPVHNIFFLKVQKCAGSTVQNMFLRFGKREKLTFVLPPDGTSVGLGEKFSRSNMLRHPSGVYNIFAHYTRFDREGIRTLMPRAKFVAIVRHPAAVFESYFHFAGWEQRYNVNLTTFLNDPRSFYLKRTSSLSPARNVMLFDFGMDETDFNNKTKIYETIQMIHNNFDLVMIAERLDESLVLLRQLLCWDWSDMVVLSANVRVAKQRKLRRLSNEQKRSIERWNWGDTILYNTFSEEFNSRVEVYGRDKMRRHLVRLHELTKAAHSHCIESTISKEDQDDVRLRTYSNDIINFRLKNNDSFCVDLAKPEHQFTNELRNVHQMNNNVHN